MNTITTEQLYQILTIVSATGRSKRQRLKFLRDYLFAQKIPLDDPFIFNYLKEVSFGAKKQAELFKQNKGILFDKKSKNFKHIPKFITNFDKNRWIKMGKSAQVCRCEGCGEEINSQYAFIWAWKKAGVTLNFHIFPECWKTKDEVFDPKLFENDKDYQNFKNAGTKLRLVVNNE